MYGFLIVGIVFSFLTISTFLEYSSKRDRQKIEAALRMEEMRRGYAPGTYSSKFDKKSKYNKHNRHDRNNSHNFNKNDSVNINKDFVDDELGSRTKERANLKNGIDDLMTRINNLETIMKEEKTDE
jgi:hypothetical protein